MWVRETGCKFEDSQIEGPFKSISSYDVISSTDPSTSIGDRVYYHTLLDFDSNCIEILILIFFSLSFISDFTRLCNFSVTSNPLFYIRKDL